MIGCFFFLEITIWVKNPLINTFSKIHLKQNVRNYVININVHNVGRFFIPQTKLNLQIKYINRDIMEEISHYIVDVNINRTRHEIKLGLPDSISAIFTSKKIIGDKELLCVSNTTNIVGDLKKTVYFINNKKFFKRKKF